jgi:hypothetical protein
MSPRGYNIFEMASVGFALYLRGVVTVRKVGRETSDVSGQAVRAKFKKKQPIPAGLVPLQKQRAHAVEPGAQNRLAA